MAYEQKDNSGSLFKNDKKTTDTHPNARGSAKIGGIEYWVSAWTKKDKNGIPWQSLAFTVKEERTKEPEPERKSVGKKGAAALDGMGDDCPF